MPPRAAYIHIPFCRRRCGYCNFTVVAGHRELQDRYLDALERELEWLGPPHETDTIYVGGGTPTELSGTCLERLCRLIRQRFPASSGYEWTMEANPAGLTRAVVQQLAAAGVNRISLGIQSFADAKLAALERDHRRPDILSAYRLCREHFASVALVLIFAAPGETLALWRDDLSAAVALAPDHLSVYGLTYEKGARFWGELRRGARGEVGEAEQAEMYELALDQLVESGWEHYEVANFARPGHRSRHNQVYWRGTEYFGVGAGAASYVAGRRQTNHRSTWTYIRRVRQGVSPVAESEALSAEERARERLVFGLRMLEGIDRAQFVRATGFDIDQLVGPSLARFVELGLLTDIAGRLRLTRRGLLVSDSLWPDFL
jgi:oxygen-independent coproporphyrinogen-3 oxidase